MCAGGMGVYMGVWMGWMVVVAAVADGGNGLGRVHREIAQRCCEIGADLCDRHIHSTH